MGHGDLCGKSHGKQRILLSEGFQAKFIKGAKPTIELAWRDNRHAEKRTDWKNGQRQKVERL
jgi:hypothetical protein